MRCSNGRFLIEDKHNFAWEGPGEGHRRRNTMYTVHIHDPYEPVHVYVLYSLSSWRRGACVCDAFIESYILSIDAVN